MSEVQAGCDAEERARNQRDPHACDRAASSHGGSLSQSGKRQAMSAALNFLTKQHDVRVALLPRNDRQSVTLRKSGEIA